MFAGSLNTYEEEDGSETFPRNNATSVSMKISAANFVNDLRLPI